jgi:hypothetical protein
MSPPAPADIAALFALVVAVLAFAGAVVTKEHRHATERSRPRRSRALGKASPRPRSCTLESPSHPTSWVVSRCQPSRPRPASDAGWKKSTRRFLEPALRSLDSTSRQDEDTRRNRESVSEASSPTLPNARRTTPSPLGPTGAPLTGTTSSTRSPRKEMPMLVASRADERCLMSPAGAGHLS